MTNSGPSKIPVALTVVAALGLLAAILSKTFAGDDSAGHALGASSDVSSPIGSSPQAFGEFPDFSLTSQEGKTITKQDLLGKPFVICAVFTNCTGPCPRISEQMRVLQDEFEGLEVMLVSVTIDPDRDTPETLGAYGAKYDADPERWLFLTGTEKEVDTLVREGFYQAVDRAGKELTHDTRLVAVDAKGRRRGWYQSQDVKSVQRLRGRMRALAAEAGNS